MTSFQIAVSLCLLAFFTITGCNDLTTQSKPQTTAIIKDVQDADAQMSAKTEQSSGITTTVEIMKKESQDMSGSEADESAAVASETDAVTPAENTDGQKADEKSADKVSKAESVPANTVTQ